MTIKIRETFEIVAPESAEHGEAESRGFIDEDGYEVTFRELVGLLQFAEKNEGATVWYTHYGFRENYEDGTVENRSYHPADERSTRYMEKAWKATNS